MADEKSKDEQDRGGKYVVSAPYITLRVPDATGADIITGFYAGAPVPENVNAEDLERHLRKDMIAKTGSTEADLLAVPAGTPVPGEPPNVPVTRDDLIGRTHQDRLARVRDAADAAKQKVTGDASRRQASSAEEKAEAKQADEQKAAARPSGGRTA